MSTYVTILTGSPSDLDSNIQTVQTKQNNFYNIYKTTGNLNIGSILDVIKALLLLIYNTSQNIMVKHHSLTDTC